MGDKIYFFSDAHLGTGEDSSGRERLLCQLLDQAKRDAHAVVMLGDMFDFWFTYRYVVPRGYVRLLGKMAELCDEGIELHFFAGNHDMWLFDYLPSEMNCKMYDDTAYYEYDGKLFYLGHGDGLGHTDRGYDRLRRIFRNRTNQRLFSLLPQWITFGIAQAWSRRSRRSHGEKLNHYFGDEREGIVIHCKEVLQKRNIDYCVFGHRHTPLLREISAPNGNKSLYLNTGDFLNHRSYGVYSPSDGLQLKECE